MSFNLRNRSLAHGPGLHAARISLSARSRPRSQARQIRADGAEAPRRQGDLSDLRKDLDPHALRVRSRLLRSGGALSPISIRPARRSATRNRSRTRRACSGACMTPSSIAARRRRASSSSRSMPACPVYNGLTDEYHPTQMLADVMTMREHSDKPIADIKYAYVGDTRSNMGHSLMIVGCLMGMDVRICGPKTAVAVRRVPEDRTRPGAKSRREAHDHGRPEGGGEGRGLHPHRRLGLDGRAEGGVEGAHRAADALSGQCGADEGERQSAGASSCIACRHSTIRRRPRQADRRRPTA